MDNLPFTICHLPFYSSISQFLNRKIKSKIEDDLKLKIRSGFTLVELLIVIAILGILATIGLVAFTSAQIRGRDTERKSDLKQISSAMELYYSDYGQYPPALSGTILGCPSNTSSPCTWGVSDNDFTDGKTTYMKVVPNDPTSNESYYYRTVSVDSVPNSGFQLFAHLENTQDESIISTNYTCGHVPCNFSITSANTKPSAN